jgi:hypothetical protein
MPRIHTVLLAATLLAGAGGAVIAQTTPGAATPEAAAGAADTQSLPTIQGRVAQYSLTPRGDVDGLILDDGTQVHMPPHLGAQLVMIAKPGDAVSVRGLKARALPVVQAAQVTNSATNQSVTDNGPPGGPHGGPHGGRGPHGGPAGEAMTAQGRIKQALYGPRGDMNGVLLDDGTQVHLPPPEAQRLAAQLATGRTLFVSGTGMASPLGTVIAAQELGPDRTQLAQVAAPPPPPGGPHGAPPPGGPGPADGAPGGQPPAPPTAR